MFEISQIVNRDVKNGTISNPSIKMLLGGKRANPCFLTLSESSDGVIKIELVQRIALSISRQKNEFQTSKWEHVIELFYDEEEGLVRKDMRIIFDILAKDGKILHRMKQEITAAELAKKNFKYNSHPSSTLTKPIIETQTFNRQADWQRYSLKVIVFTRVARELSISSLPGLPLLRNFESGSTLLSNFKQLFLDEEAADVTVKASDGVELRVHKLILTTQSTVFKTMFNIEMTEKERSVVEIKDFDSKVLKELFRFMYCGKVETNEEINLEIIRAARRYEIEELPDICAQLIIKSFEDIDIWGTLEIAHVYNLEELFQLIATIFFFNKSFYSQQPEWIKQRDMSLKAKVYECFDKLYELKDSVSSWKSD